MSSLLRIAIASDLHAYKYQDGKPNFAPSKLCLSAGSSSSAVHPVSGLHALIENERLTADLLLSPGDLTFAADPDGIEYSWRTLQEFGTRLDVSMIAGTVGNHDIDSRQITRAEDPKERLLRLRPRFPIDDAGSANDYWTHGFTIRSSEKFNLLLLNSCVRHNPGTDEKARAELERGYVTEYMLEELRDRLKVLQPRPANILLCHHHPHQHSELRLGEEDVMRRGQLLLDLLAKHANWVVVHGHKHHPKVTYAAGGANSPVVLAAGSFAGNFGLEAETRTRNQFHLIELDLERSRFGIHGQVRSWNWLSQLGWKRPDGRDAGLPYVAGFGSRRHPADLALDVVKRLRTSQYKEWEVVEKQVIELKYLIPQDYEALKDELRTVHNVRIQEDNGMPVQIGLVS